MSRLKTCRGCGCTDLRACPGGCYWFTEDCCSNCVEKVFGWEGLVDLAWSVWEYQRRMQAMAEAFVMAGGGPETTFSVEVRP
jgi:hypothetical protein